jgi:hypothetical protein
LILPGVIYRGFCESIFKTTGISRRTSETNVQTKFLSAHTNHSPLINRFIFNRLHQAEYERQPTDFAKVEDAAPAQLLEQVNRIARVNSMRAKMDLKFEDNSYAELGIAEKYKTADGEVVVQRPGKILLKVQVPIIKTDVAQMTSDGEKFRVAVLEDGGSGKYRKFVSGTNSADYSSLQAEVNQMDFNAKDIKQNVNAFSNLRPQHFTNAMLMRPIDAEKFSYSQSTIQQQEENLDVAKKSPLRMVFRGYYLLDELRKNADGSLTVSRRFWFDRVGTVRLARQQIFDEKGEIEIGHHLRQDGQFDRDGRV